MNVKKLKRGGNFYHIQHSKSFLPEKLYNFRFINRTMAAMIITQQKYKIVNLKPNYILKIMSIQAAYSITSQ